MMRDAETRRAHHPPDDVQASHRTQMALHRDHVRLLQTHSAVERSKRIVAAEIKRDQKIFFHKFQVSVLW